MAERGAHVALRHRGRDSDGYSVPHMAGWLPEDRSSFEHGPGHTRALAARIIAAQVGTS